jgi:hypothetical protein
MIIRFLWLAAIFFLLNLNALANTLFAIGGDRQGRVHFFRGFDRQDHNVAREQALASCMNMQGIIGCKLFYDGIYSQEFSSQECIAIVVGRSPALGESIYHAKSAIQSAAVSDAEAQCNSSILHKFRGLREAWCDPAGVGRAEQPYESSFVIDGRRIKRADDTPTPYDSIPDFIEDSLNHRKAPIFYTVAFAFGLFVLLSLYDVIGNNRRSVRRMGVNLVLSCTATAGVVTIRLLAPVIWEWMLSLDTPTVVLLGTMACGMTALFIPRTFWQTLRQGKTVARSSRLETSKNTTSVPEGSGAELNKKAIKEAALRSVQTEEFEV